MGRYGGATGHVIGGIFNSSRTKLRSVILEQALISSLFEVPQIWWRLVFFGRHQIAVRTEIVVFLAQANPNVGLGTDLLGPPGGPGVFVARVILGHRPGTRIGMIDQRDLIMQDVRVGLVEIDALLDDALIVLVSREQAVQRAGTLDETGLDLE